MTETTVSFRVDKSVYDQMRLRDEVNWSAVLRNTVHDFLQKTQNVERAEALDALRIMDSLRKSKAFDAGRDSLEILKEWRQKRK